MRRTLTKNATCLSASRDHLCNIRAWVSEEAGSPYFWQRGHHAVVRPPIIAWRKGVR
jgi:hypothetical protein